MMSAESVGFLSKLGDGKYVISILLCRLFTLYLGESSSCALTCTGFPQSKSEA